MSDRDAARDLARQSKLDSDWIQYKNLRNRCTRLQAIDKKKRHEQSSYNFMAEKQ